MSGPQITIAAVPKAFEGHIGTLQRNALGSWRRLPDVAEILLVGDEDGLVETAAEFGMKHVGGIRRDEEGAPHLDAAFEAVDSVATTDWICYVNADIVLLPAFWTAAQKAIRALGRSLIVSRRWNLAVPHALSFDDDWIPRLRRAARTEGELFTPFGLDVFVYPRGMYAHMPSFSVGAFSWDNWLVHEARKRGLPVVDLTTADGVIHQNHGYQKFANADDYRRRSPRALRNYWLAGDSAHGLSSAADATHVLQDGEIVQADTRSVSVIISDIGSAAQLTACLAAFEYQTYPRTFTEVIVAVEAGRTAPNAVLADFPFVQRVRAAVPGRAAARNKGAAVATGELLAFLSSDALPAADWVAKAVCAVDDIDDSSIVVSTLDVRQGRGGSAAVGYYESLSFRRSRQADRSPRAIGDGVLVTRATWRLVGPFDQELPALVADYAWLAQAAANGVAVVEGPCEVRRTLNTDWRQLTSDVRGRVRSEVALAQLDSQDRLGTRGARWSAWTRRLAAETTATALREAEVPIGAWWGVRAAAAWAWVVRLDESLPDRRLSPSVLHRSRPSRTLS